MIRKKRFPALLLALLLALPPKGLAEPIPPGRYAAEMERRALAQGLALQTEISFDWGGLPLLDQETDGMLGSLLGALMLTSERQGVAGNGYLTLDALLKSVSVLDLVMQAEDGVYYEQSNLLGGQTVAFTTEDFRDFARRLSQQSGGAIPSTLGPLFPLVMATLGMTQTPREADMTDAAQAHISRWAEDALTAEEALRPHVRLPGRYGLRADVIEITRDELLALVDGLSALLENDALREDMGRAQAPQLESPELAASAQELAVAMRNLPALARGALPADMPPVTYRRVYGADDMLTAKQLSIILADDQHLALEWAAGNAETLPIFARLRLGDSTLELIITHEVGAPQVSRSQTTTQNRLIAQLGYATADLHLDAVLTRSESITTIDGRETRALRTDCRILSDALLGEGTQLVLTAQTTETAAGTPGSDYRLRAETVLSASGPGFDDAPIVSISRRVTTALAEPPANPLPGSIVYPAQMRDDAFSDWLNSQQGALMQAIFTILGRLPPDVAAYLLARLSG